MRNPESTNGPQVITTNWFVGHEIDEAWLKVLTNRRIQLTINRQPVKLAHNRPPDLDNGDWKLGKESALDPVTKPELLDPDEVGEFFVGKQFENPRDAQADLKEFINLKPKTHLPYRNYKTTNRAEDGGEFDPTRTLAQSRSTPSKPDLPPDLPIPNSLKRDRAKGGLLAYSIGPMLKPGWNEIQIKQFPESKLNWQPAIAIDGEVLGGNVSTPVPNPSEWFSLNPRGEKFALQECGSASIIGNSLPRLHFRGTALSPTTTSERFVQELRNPVWIVAFCIFAIIAIGSLRVGFLQAICKRLSPALFVVITSLLCGILVEMSFHERHESLWFQQGVGWKWVIVTTAIACLFTLCWNLFGRRIFLQKTGNVSAAIIDLPNTGVWKYILLAVVLICVVLRGYQLDVQPLDDDEYASTQAILAILETGVPKFAPEDVYYTRSPLYHYVSAGLAYPFGGNLWSLRLQSVMWSVGTVLLAYLCGSRLLGSRWIGFAAMLLLSIHPFQVFTGHVIRFYQMQQFFALLTIFLFCKGFVTEQKQLYRVATILSFLAAVLSQEISAVMGVPLLAGYFLFAKDLGWQKNVQLILISIGVVFVVAVDLIAFQTLCLTRTEGVSPSIEASIKPHFWYPLNLFSIFIGYSRLHIVPSFVFLMGCLLIWREKNRNAIAMLVFFASGVLMTNLLVTHVSLRYQYWLFPIWILTSLTALRVVAVAANDLLEFMKAGFRKTDKTNAQIATLSSTKLRAVISTLVMITIIFSWSPWRMLGSYDSKILGDSTGCVRWVRSQMMANDKLAITEPHTHAGLLEGGGVDYDLAIPLLYDFAVFRDGRLVDRNGGGELVSSLDDLLRVFEKDERVWILLNREKFRTRGKNMRWEYPGARFEQFVRKNCELKHRTYLWHAYLWDPSRGHFTAFSKQQ
jgi:4-amino-4-deoxy-L-arabinose transferase-like glycosyltransferase